MKSLRRLWQIKLRDMQVKFRTWLKRSYWVRILKSFLKWLNNFQNLKELLYFERLFICLGIMLLNVVKGWMTFSPRSWNSKKLMSLSLPTWQSKKLSMNWINWLKKLKNLTGEWKKRNKKATLLSVWSGLVILSIAVWKFTRRYFNSSTCRSPQIVRSINQNSPKFMRSLFSENRSA